MTNPVCWKIKKAAMKVTEENKENECLKRKHTDEMRLIEKDLSVDLHKEGMLLLQSALEAKDLSKVHAANAFVAEKF